MKTLSNLHLAGATLIDPKPRNLLRFIPKGNWVEITRVANRFGGAIQLTNDEGKYEALVKAIGPDVTSCAVGDYIVAMNIREVAYAGETHYLVRDGEGQIVAVVEELPSEADKPS